MRPFSADRIDTPKKSDRNDSRDDCNSCFPDFAVANECNIQIGVRILSPNGDLDLCSGDSYHDRSLKTEWLNSEEAASFLRISVKALRNMTSNGRLPFYKLGRRNRYRRVELESILHSQKRGKHYGN